VSVLNAGISGNRLLRDVAGPNALARFERDVLGQSGVRFLIVLEGINDIGRSYQGPDTEGPVTVKDLIFAYEQIVNKAHQRGIKVIGGTIMPYEGAGYYSSQGEQVRQTINKWIRSSKVFDGVIDFDEVTRDPAHPSRLLSAVDSGDRLHPGDEGYKTMGTAIDLSFFRRP
jgi:lysophospholipase L1-like esterase